VRPPDQSWSGALATWREASPDATAFRFLGDGEEEAGRLTWAELDARVSAVASALCRLGLEGERILLLHPPGLPFVTAFLGCLRSGAVAVPVYPPHLVRPDASLGRLLTVAADCRPAAAIVSSAQLTKLEAMAPRHEPLRGLRWLSCESLEAGASEPPASGDRWPPPGGLAFLQYTSGSTSTPRGVRVTHANITHNARHITAALGLQPRQALVSWLPPYHDMGLVGYLLQPLFIGAETTLMSPASFLQRPLRWLEAISRYRGSVSHAPNFAYELVLRRVRPDHLIRLDLSCWSIAGNGAEPVRLETMERFAATFEACGFRRDAFQPCYGLAECTLLASTARGIAAMTVDATRLERHEVAPCDRFAAAARAVVSVGRPAGELTARIVDPESMTPAGADRVGEIWLAGPAVADGYFNRPDESRATFNGRAGSDPRPYLRTGDLGFVRDGALYVTGRLKDLIILDGRNHYPQDIEETVRESLPSTPPGGAIAFSIDRDGCERLVVAVETRHAGRPAGGEDDETADGLLRRVRRAIAERHDIQLYALVQVPAGRLPRTGSGKPQRRACRARYLQGALEGEEVGT
jgi:acyl-CoA synthetase (AMP-forming)/AMP-acid ligase II